MTLAGMNGGRGADGVVGPGRSAGGAFAAPGCGRADGRGCGGVGRASARSPPRPPTAWAFSFLANGPALVPLLAMAWLVAAGVPAWCARGRGSRGRGHRAAGLPGVRHAVRPGVPAGAGVGVVPRPRRGARPAVRGTRAGAGPGHRAGAGGDDGGARGAGVGRAAGRGRGRPRGATLVQTVPGGATSAASRGGGRAGRGGQARHVPEWRRLMHGKRVFAADPSPAFRPGDIRDSSQAKNPAGPQRRATTPSLGFSVRPRQSPVQGRLAPGGSGRSRRRLRRSTWIVGMAAEGEPGPAWPTAPVPTPLSRAR